MYDSKTQNIINEFHRLYYNNYNQTWENTKWFGIKVQKTPLDLWIYQEIIFETQPDIIIETGTANGGSALYLACICDLLGKGIVITIDVLSSPRPAHHRIYYLGSSTSIDTFTAVKNFITPNDKVMVILDSDHSMNHVLNEMNLYCQLVTKDNYLIVEDTNINGHPVLENFGPGPMEAVVEFLKTNKSFIIDYSREKFYLTFNPMGYLKKVV